MTNKIELYSQKFLELFNNNFDEAIKQIEQSYQDNTINMAQEMTDFFLAASASGNIDLEAISKYLTMPNHTEILEYFMGKQDFQGKSLIDALELLLKNVKFPQQEEQCTILAKSFAERYCEQNPEFKVKEAYNSLVFKNEVASEVEAATNLVLHTKFLSKWNLNRQNIDEEDKKWDPTELIQSIHLDEQHLNNRSAKDLDSASEMSRLTAILDPKKVKGLQFDFVKIVPSYILDSKKLRGDKIYNNFISFLAAHSNMERVFPSLESVTLFPPNSKKKTWKSFFTGYKTKLLAAGTTPTATEIHTSIPNLLNRLFFKKKPEIKIQFTSNKYTMDDLILTAKIAAQFQSDPPRIITNYSYEQKQMSKAYREEHARLLASWQQVSNKKAVQEEGHEPHLQKRVVQPAETHFTPTPSPTKQQVAKPPNNRTI